jgi:hypothetical protein
LPAARLAFFWFWVLSFDLACLRCANVSWFSVLSFDLVRLGAFFFLLGSRRSLWIWLAYTQSSVLRNVYLRNHWWGGARKRINQKGPEPGNAIISDDSP